MKTGCLIVIVAPSGSGKTTLISRLKTDFPQIEESVSATTRPQRQGERNGQHYQFVTPKRFAAKVAAGDFLEWAHVHSHCYGTERIVVERGLETPKILLFDLDIQGSDFIKQAYPQAHVIFIEPPSLAHLETRLRERGTEAEETIQLRLKNARKELARKEDFDYLVVNDHLERAYRDLKQVVGEIIAEHSKE